MITKFSEVGKHEWDSKKNLTDMLNPIWILLDGNADGKVSLHEIFSLIAVVLDGIISTTISLQEVWSAGIPAALPKATQAIFDLFAATEYDVDKNGTLSFDEAIQALEKTGLLAEMDKTINQAKVAKEQMENAAGEMETEVTDSAFKAITDGKAMENLMPKLKEQLEALKKAPPSAMSVLKSVGAGGITEEVFVSHMLKVVADSSTYQESISEGILNDVIIPGIKAQKTIKEEDAMKLVTDATGVYNRLKTQMKKENDQLCESLSRAIFALLDINGDGKISMGEINTMRKINFKDEMCAKDLVEVLLTMMDRDGNKEIEAKELSSLLLRVYKFITGALFGIQRYTSHWVVRLLKDQGFADVVVDFAKIAASYGQKPEIRGIADRLGQGVTLSEAIEIYESQKLEAEA